MNALLRFSTQKDTAMISFHSHHGFLPRALSPKQSYLGGQHPALVGLVAVLAAASVWSVFFFATTPSPSLAHEGSGQEIVNNTPPSTLTSPDLTRIHPVDYLDLIPEGKPAPTFKAQDSQGHTVELGQFKGKKNTVLIFYQGSFCGVCAKQLENLQTHYKEFKDRNTEIIAISADDMTHAKMTKGELGLSFPVIPDPGTKLIKTFGVENISKQGIAYPSAYLIDKSGTVVLSFADRNATRLDSSALLTEIDKRISTKK